MNEPEWEEVERQATSGTNRSGQPIRAINLARLRPIWDGLVARLRGTSAPSGWVVRGLDGRYLWDDPVLGVRMPSCTGVNNALRFETEEAAEEAARKAFKGDFRKSMVMPL